MRPANLAKSASFSIRVLALRMIVLLRSPRAMLSKRARRSSASIWSGVRQSSRPMAANSMRFLRSRPFQSSVVPSARARTTLEGWEGAADEGDGDAVGVAGEVELGGALEQEALGDVVGVVVDEGLLDEHVKVV